MSAALNGLTILAVCAGSFFFMAGTVGLLRFPDTLSRLHALTKADNLGCGLVVIGLLFKAEGLLAAMQLICIGSHPAGGAGSRS
jgi:multicomponent Na+:H+ antiporter subunit G